MASRNDILFCKIAIFNGLITRSQAAEVLPTIGKGEKEVGTALVERGYLSEPDRRATVVALQELLQRRGEEPSEGVSGAEKSLLLTGDHLPAIVRAGPNWKIVGAVAAGCVCIMAVTVIVLSSGRSRQVEEPPVVTADSNPVDTPRRQPSEDENEKVEIERQVLALLERAVGGGREGDRARAELAEMRHPDAVRVLCQVAAADPAARRRFEAVGAIAAIGGAEWIDPLVKAMDDPDSDVVRAAKEGLRKSHDNNAVVGRLLTRLGRRDGTGFIHAIELLGRVGEHNEKAFAALKGLAENETCGTYARISLKNMGPKGIAAAEEAESRLKTASLVQMLRQAEALKESGQVEQSHAAMQEALKTSDRNILEEAWRQSGIAFEGGAEAYRDSLFAQLQGSRGLVTFEGKWVSRDEARVLKTELFRRQYAAVLDGVEAKVKNKSLEEALKEMDGIAGLAAGSDFESHVNARRLDVAYLLNVKRGIIKGIVDKKSGWRHTFANSTVPTFLLSSDETGIRVRFKEAGRDVEETKRWTQIEWIDYYTLGREVIPNGDAAGCLALAAVCVEAGNSERIEAELKRAAESDKEGAFTAEIQRMHQRADLSAERAKKEEFNLRARKIRELMDKTFAAQNAKKIGTAMEYVNAIEKYKDAGDYEELLATHPAGKSVEEILKRFDEIKTAHYLAGKYVKIKDRWYNPKEAELMQVQDGPWVDPMVKETRYYIIKTDAGAGFLDELARRMDMIYERYQSVFAYDKPLKIRLVIKVFSKQKQFMEYSGAPAAVGGLYNSQKMELVSFLTPDSPMPGLDIYTVMFHEATHQFAHLVFAQGFSTIPIWFQEGIAVFFESSTFDGKVIQIGRIPKERLEALQNRVASNSHVPFSELIRTPQSSFGGAHYAEAWSIIYYMMNHNESSRQMLKEYVSKLKSGKNGDEAFTEAFNISFEKFEKQWKPWILALKPDKE